ncbi:hypothetical protein QBC34DRAFT_473986 [Podospora aff. communis PSN243]|uniref:Uncharacterized protein n=1 Tax=Podospora aff. communis PSN243 TaxID=3040156 RepID=A0AAV9G9J6_9PEZI|nr:hypothetical protein QBC34DRAFT_473986 [Podospora aff. communis PSN243]
MSVPANVSSTGAFQVADWTPPPIESLDFTTDCDLVHGFYSGWFSGLMELGLGEDNKAVYDLPFSRNETTFFVASSIDANVTEAYFRTALPPEIRNVPSYGQILDWEFALRTNFSRALPALAALPAAPVTPENGPFEWLMNSTYQAPYFTRVLRDPGLVCRKEACSGFQWDRLVDINGPGVYGVYWTQVATMVLASLVVIFELFMTRSRKPGAANLTYSRFHSSFYRCFRRMVEAMIQGAAYFFAVVPLALFVEFATKGPHYFPPTDQNVSLVISCLSLFMLIWAWRMNRCFAAIDLVKGFSPVDSGQGHLPLACALICVPFLGFLLYIRTQSAQFESDYLDAFNFNTFFVTICQGIDFSLVVHRQTEGAVNTNGLFIITRLAITVMAYSAARLLWDDLTVRTTAGKLIPLIKSKEFEDALHDAVLKTESEKGSSDLDDADLDRLTTRLHRDPRTNAHIWLTGYGEMIGIGACALYTLIEYEPWPKAEVDWSQLGEQWNLGQILSLFTMAPVLVEIIMSAQWVAKGEYSGNFVWQLQKQLSSHFCSYESFDTKLNLVPAGHQ